MIYLILSEPDLVYTTFLPGNERLNPEVRRLSVKQITTRCYAQRTHIF
jgi:hypothetical protein